MSSGRSPRGRGRRAATPLRRWSRAVSLRMPNDPLYVVSTRFRSTRLPVSDRAREDESEEGAMDHRRSDALEAAVARRGDLHRALLDLERALAGGARGRAQAWADLVRATLVRVRETFTAHVD